MTARPAALLPLAAAALALAGCAKDAGLYPSLSIRDQERVTGVFEPVQGEPYVPAPAGPEALSRLAQLRADAQAAHKDFLAAAERARGPVAAAKGAAVGSEAWSVAQVALGDLSAARSATMIPLGELDLIHADTLDAEGDTAQVEAVRGEVEQLLAGEDGVLEALSAQVAY